MRTGDLYQVNLDPSAGRKIRKSGPVVILNPGHAKSLGLAIVVPVTAWKRRWDGNPFFLTIDRPKAQHGLRKKSAIDCFQVRALGHSRFIKKLGSLSGKELDHIKKALALILDIDPEHCELDLKGSVRVRTRQDFDGVRRQVKKKVSARVARNG